LLEKSFEKVASSKNRREEGFGLPMDIEPDIRMMFHLSPLKHLHFSTYRAINTALIAENNKT